MNKRFSLVTDRRTLALVAAWAASAATAFAQGGGAPPKPTPPPEPPIKPTVSAPRDQDKNASKVGDGLESRAASARGTLARSTASSAEQAAARQALETTVGVELIFDRQITQQQIDAFLAAGGKIDHVFESVSYGWIGTIPLGKIEGLPAALGKGLLGIIEPPAVQLYNLQEAAGNGRVRPGVWDNGIAGTSDITIAILDTGVFASHTDLAGRQQLWLDATGEGDLTPVDHGHHGTHVTGIATGTGAASGSGATTVEFTQNGTFPSVAGSFFPAVFSMPASASNFNWSSTLRWDTSGGGEALIDHYKTNGAGGFNFSGANWATGPTTPLSMTNNGTVNPNSYGTGLFTPLVTWTVAGPGTLAYSAQHSVTYNAGDTYNAMRGVAPGSRWAGYKVFKNDGSGLTSYTDIALDHMVTNRVLNNIKVANLSLGANGDPGINTSSRNKVNTAAENGIVVVVAAGNDGKKGTASARETDDPGRAHYAITVGASSPLNQLTNYSSVGFNAPGDANAGDQDQKPDLAAPGGSDNTGLILSVDSGTNDDSFADGEANDYTLMKGTSMAAPFIAGCAALIIDALQQSGHTWRLVGVSGEPLSDVMKVKQLLLMTASETNQVRETGTTSGNPTLNRGAKDIQEGYGVVNTDAAVDAVRLSPLGGAEVTVLASADTTFGSGTTDKRVWARRINLTAGKDVSLSVGIPPGADFDAYIYDADPNTYGNPVILASSTTATSGGTETISFTPGATEIGYLVVKRVSGSGAFSVGGSVPVSVSHFAIY